MYYDKILKKDKPFIFSKKLNDNSRTIPLNSIKNTLGPTRYYPPANQEWSNSIYAYNNIYVKNISIAQKNLTNLIKSYFNIYFSNKLLSSKPILTRSRRFSVNRIFFSKAELKHTSDKVIITLYVYNEERRILINRLRRVEAVLFPSYNISSLEASKDATSPLSFKKRLNLIHKKEFISFLGLLEDIKNVTIEQIMLGKKDLELINKLNIKKDKLLEIKTLEKNLNRILAIMSSCLNNSDALIHYENIYINILNNNILEKEIATIAYYKLLLSLNKYKFEDLFLSKLSPLVNKIYNKEVEFNIVNLKAIYLNSDIFTQAIALKLRDRNNRLLIVLKNFLHMVKLSKVNPLKGRFSYINIKNLWVNKIKNLRINSLAPKFNRDNINELLTSLLTTSNFSKFKNNTSLGIGGYVEDKTSLINSILFLLKHKSISGVRLEAKGRLTRRFTASRSLFKVKWKGSLKNIDSSYRGWSSVILRGHTKSNVQYSVVNSKTRNGAFGLKGWISGK